MTPAPPVNFSLLSLGTRAGGGSPHGPLKLRCLPRRLVTRNNWVARVRVSLENTIDRPVWVYLRLVPILAGPGNPLRTLKVQCRDAKTGRSARWLVPPGRMAQGREIPEEVLPHHSSGAVLNLTDYYRLPPGTYLLTQWYDTSQIGKAVPIDRRAWHGITNTTTTTVRVLP